MQINYDDVIKEKENIIHAVIRDTFPSKQFDQDYIQIGRIAMWKALKNYAKAGSASFNTYAYKCIKNDMIKEWTKENAVKRKANQLMSESEINNPDKLMQDNTWLIPHGKIQLESILPSLTEKQTTILELLLAGYSVKEIAKKLNVGISTVYAEREKMRKEVTENILQ